MVSASFVSLLTLESLLFLSFPKVTSSLRPCQRYNHVRERQRPFLTVKRDEAISIISGKRRRYRKCICYRNVVSLRETIKNDTGKNQNLQSSELIVTDKDRGLGILVLLTVPLAWGTYTPVVRFLYTIEPPVPGFVFSAAYYIVATIVLRNFGSLFPSVIEDEKDKHENVKSDHPSDEVRFNDVSTRSSDTTSTAYFLNASALVGGLELGGYLFIGNALQVIGLRTVPADRAGFLVQLTTLIVPVLQAIAKGSVGSITNETWFSCILAFVGVIIIGIDNKGQESIFTLISSRHNFSIPAFPVAEAGDILIVLAAFFYSLHVVRLSRYAKVLDPLQLAASKATTEAILSIGLIALLVAYHVDGTFLYEDATTLAGLNDILAFADDSGKEIFIFYSKILENIQSETFSLGAFVPAIGAVLWTGIVTCAYTIYAQSFGQSRVGPTDANLIYTMQPLFTALFAYVLLGETLGPAGFLGASLIAISIYVVAK